MRYAYTAGSSAALCTYAVKTAAIFGAASPSAIEHGEIPYAVRRRMYSEYAHEKAKEEPTGYLKGIGGGALMGAVPGALLSLYDPVLGGALGGLGGIVGGLTGAGMAAHDKDNIARAQRALAGDGHLENALADQIVRNKRDSDNVRAMNQAHYNSLFQSMY